MPYCSQCGAEVDNKTNFCPDCGAPIKKREKRAAVIPLLNLPPQKTLHGEARPVGYRAERTMESRAQENGVAAGKTRDFKAASQPGEITAGPKPQHKDMQAQTGKDNIKSALVTAAIIIGVLLIVPQMVLGYPIWEIFSDGGGGGSANFDGTYYGNSYTVTPMGSTSGSGYFTVRNGYVSEGWFQGSVDSSGYFVGTIIVSQGSPAITVTGRFSLTSTFRLSGSNSTGSTSWTLDAYKI